MNSSEKTSTNFVNYGIIVLLVMKYKTRYERVNEYGYVSKPREFFR